MTAEQQSKAAAIIMDGLTFQFDPTEELRALGLSDEWIIHLYRLSPEDLRATITRAAPVETRKKHEATLLNNKTTMKQQVEPPLVIKAEIRQESPLVTAPKQGEPTLQPTRENGQGTGTQWPISELLSLGARIIGAYDSGAMIAKGDDYQAAFTSSLEEVKALYLGRGDSQGRAKGIQIRRFRYFPQDAGFIVLDLDRKNGKDGIAELPALIRSAGLVVPRILADLDGGSFPCYVTTPSGGLHLYFKAPAGCTYRKEQIGQSGAIELFHAGQPITAPGSEKDRKAYELHGSFKDAPPWPPILARIMQDKRPVKIIPSKPRGRFTLTQTYTYCQKQQKGIRDFLSMTLKSGYSEGETRAYLSTMGHKVGDIESAMVELKKTTPPTLADLAKWAEGKASGRHDLCLHITGSARRTGHTADETRAFLETYPGTAGHDQIDSTIASIYGSQGQ